MILKRYFTNRPYDLHWDSGFAESIILFSIFALFPYSPEYPITEVFCLLVIAYYSIRYKKPNILGFSLNISISTARIAIYILAAMILLNVVFFLGWHYMKIYVYENSVTEIINDMPMQYYWMERWEPGNYFDLYVLNSNVLGMFYTIWKPLLLTVIIAPVIESVFLIAIIYPALWKKFGSNRAMIIVCCLTLALHFPNLNEISIFTYSIAAIVWIILYVKTKSIYCTILMHACQNLTIGLMPIYVNWGLDLQKIPGIE